MITALIVSFVLFAGIVNADTIQITLKDINPDTSVKTKTNGRNLKAPAGVYVIDVSGYQTSAFSLNPIQAPTKKTVEYELLPVTEEKYIAAAYALYLVESHSILSFEEKTAAQLAVWEIVLDWNDRMAFNFTEGNFILRDTGWTDLAESILEKTILGHAGLDITDYLLAFPVQKDEHYPPYVLHSIPNSSVPLPPAGILVATGLVFFIWALRRTTKPRVNKRCSTVKSHPHQDHQIK